MSGDRNGAEQSPPITPDDVRGWFLEAMKAPYERPQIHPPNATDCAGLADRINSLVPIVQYYTRPRPAIRPRKTELHNAFDKLIFELRAEIEDARRWESKTYALDQQPELGSYSDCLADILRQVEISCQFIDRSRSLGLESEFRAISVEIAARVLAVWNRTRRRRSTSIGKATPCESVLTRAVTVIFGSDVTPDRVRTEVARAGKEKLLHELTIYMREV